MAGFLGVLSWEDVRALQAESWNFGGHTATRARLAACAPPVLEREVVAPLEALQRELGISPPTNSQVGVGFGMTRDNGWIRVRIDHILTGAQWRA